MTISRQKVFDEIERFGLDAVKKRVVTINQTVAPKYDEYIKDYEESTALERREAREEESLSISRKAFRISIIAIISAIIAIALNIITYIWPPK